MSDHPSMLAPNDAPGYVGILLAAGRGTRFDAAGCRNKLLQVLSSGDTVVARAAQNLRAATGAVLAVIPVGSPVLAIELASHGFAVSKCIDAESGMAASLVHGIRQTADALGWVIALGDMPCVQAETIARLVDALAQGADIAVPVYQGRRGNPVAFSRRHLDDLLALSGDVGARRLLQTCPVREVPVTDPGIFRDIDTPSDLEQCRSTQESVHV